MENTVGSCVEEPSLLECQRKTRHGRSNIGWRSPRVMEVMAPDRVQQGNGEDLTEARLRQDIQEEV